MVNWLRQCAACRHEVVGRGGGDWYGTVAGERAI